MLNYDCFEIGRCEVAHSSVAKFFVVYWLPRCASVEIFPKLIDTVVTLFVFRLSEARRPYNLIGRSSM